MEEDDISCFSTRKGAKRDRLDLEGHSNCTTSMDTAELAFLFPPMLSVTYSSVICQAFFLAYRQLSMGCGGLKKRYVQSDGKTSNAKTFNVQNPLNPGTVGRL